MTVTFKSEAVVLQAHERVHSGAASTLTIELEDMPKKSDHNILLHVGGQNVHLFEFASRSDGGDSKIALFEEPLVVSIGVPIEPEGNHRSKALKQDIDLTHYAEIDFAGRFLTSSPSYKLSSEFQPCQEWILAPSKTYLVRASNPLGKKVEMTIRIFFYILD